MVDLVQSRKEAFWGQKWNTGEEISFYGGVGVIGMEMESDGIVKVEIGGL